MNYKIINIFFVYVLFYNVLMAGKNISEITPQKDECGQSKTALSDLISSIENINKELTDRSCFSDVNRLPPIQIDLENGIPDGIKIKSKDENSFQVIGPKNRYIVSKTVKINNKKIQGAHGKFHVAIDELGREYAVKEVRLIPKENPLADKEYTTPVLKNELVKEINLAGQFGKDYRVEDAVLLQNGNALLFMPLFPGGDLDDIQKKSQDKLQGNIENHQRDIALSIMNDVVGQLNEIHTKNYVHRDLKPGNIFLGRNGNVSIADFGTVIPLNKKNQIIGPKGLPGYTSIEMVDAEANNDFTRAFDGKASEVFSLGVIFSELLQGEGPFSTKAKSNLSEKEFDEINSKYIDFKYSYSDWVDDNGKIDIKKVGASNDFVDSNLIDEYFLRLKNKNPELCKYILEKMLNPSPEKRASTSEVLKWISDYISKNNIDIKKAKSLLSNVSKANSKSVDDYVCSLAESKKRTPLPNHDSNLGIKERISWKNLSQETIKSLANEINQENTQTSLMSPGIKHRTEIKDGQRISEVVSENGNRYYISQTLTNSSGEKIQGTSGKIRLAINNNNEQFVIKELRLADPKRTEEGVSNTKKSELSDIEKEALYTNKYGENYNVSDMIKLPNNNVLMLLPLMEGGDVQKVINQLDGQDRYTSSYFAISQMAKSIEKMHKDDIIHFDIKPENALVNGKGMIALSDFGSAMSKSQTHDYNAEQMNVLGTPGYMAPEINKRMLMLIGKEDKSTLSQLPPVSTKADVYSLGISFMELLTGKHPLMLNFLNNNPGDADYLLHAQDSIKAIDSFINSARDKVSGKINVDELIKKSSAHSDNSIEKNVGQLCNSDKDACIFILDKMLTQDPSKRASIEDVIAFLNTKQSMFKNNAPKILANKVSLSERQKKTLSNLEQKSNESVPVINSKQIIKDKMDSISRDERRWELGVRDPNYYLENMITALNLGRSPKKEDLIDFWKSTEKLSKQNILHLLGETYYLQKKQIQDGIDNDEDDEDDLEKFHNDFISTIKKSALEYRKGLSLNELDDYIQKTSGDIDSHGNVRAHVIFESLLSQKIVERRELWEAPFLKVNHNIIKRLEKASDLIDELGKIDPNQLNESQKESLSDAKKLIQYALEAGLSFSNEKGKAKMNISDISDHLNNKDFDLNDILSFYKLFFEKIYDDFEKKEVSKNILSSSDDKISPMALNIRDMALNPNRKIWKNIARPDEFFSGSNRGRGSERYVSKGTLSGGITDKVDTPEELINAHSRSEVRGKQQFNALEDSEHVKKMRSAGVPLIGGSSGSMGYHLWGMSQLIDISQDDLNKIFLGASSGLVYGGHHSYYEAMLVKDSFLPLDKKESNLDTPGLTYKSLIKGYIPDSFWKERAGKKLLDTLK